MKDIRFQLLSMTLKLDLFALYVISYGFVLLLKCKDVKTLVCSSDDVNSGMNINQKLVGLMVRIIHLRS